MSTTTVILDPDGDLLLRANTVDPAKDGTRWTTFQVCSATLRRASPVWKAMLFGPWAESKQSNQENEDWIVSLPADSPCTLKIVLAIIHGQFELVPERLEIAAFSDILKLTDKYDLRKVIRPWTRRWVGAIDWLSLKLRIELIQAARVAWELGLEEKLVIPVKKLALEETLEDVDQHLVGTAANSSDSHLAWHVTRCRARLIRELLRFHSDKLVSLTEQASLEGCRLGEVDDAERQLCCRVVLGGFAAYLVQKKFTTLEIEIEYTGSVNQLMALLKEMYSQVVTLPRHERCNPTREYLYFQQEFLNRLERFTVLAWVSKRELEKQRKESGL